MSSPGRGAEPASLPPLPPTIVETRDALHAVAEQVCSAARYRATAKIGLRVTEGGVGTPPFGDGEVVRVDVTELVHEQGGSIRRTRLTTLAAAAKFVGVPLGAPPVYPAATHLDPHEQLAVDATAAQVVASWFALADGLLDELRRAHARRNPSAAQVWPEHFDLAVDVGDESTGTRATFGASTGDDTIPVPYFYVSPWDASRKVGLLAREPFGAAITYDELRGHEDPLVAAREFYAACAHAVFDGAG